MTTHIAKVLEKNAKDMPIILSAFKEARIISAWNRSVSGKIAQNTLPEKFMSGTLYIRTKNSVWSQELNSLKTNLLEKINTLLGTRSISDLKFKTGAVVVEKEKERSRKTVKCSRCGAEHKGTDKMCNVCSIETGDEIAKIIYQILGSRPWIKYDELGDHKKIIGQDNFSRLKRDMKYRMLDNLIIGKHDLTKKRWETLFQRYVEAVINKQFKAVSENDIAGVRKAVQNKVNNYSRRRKLR